MGTFKDLSHQEGRDKIKELAKNADICMFATNMHGNPVPARPMSTQDVDDDGVLWFFSKSNSNKNAEIYEDPRVQLFYSNKESAEFLSVSGHAVIIKDEAKAKDLWSPMVRTWFDGPDDPELTLIKVVPENAYYWDTKHNKMIALMKMVAGAITGKELDDSIEGNITAVQ